MRTDGSDNELISVALCTYNGGRYLSEQLESIIRQSYSNLEIIIVDDFSQDGTVAIVEQFMARDFRIKLYRNSCNIGYVKSFSRALSLCKGELVALADQDDIWLEDKISFLAQEIGRNLMIYSAVSVIDENGNLLDVKFPRVNRIEGRCPLSLVIGNCVTGHASLARKELLELALPAMNRMPYHDQWLAIVAAASGRLKASPRMLSYYRKHQSNAVLGAKNRRETVREEAFITKHAKLDLLMRNILEADVLEIREQRLLTEFRRLSEKNMDVFYNFELRRFLMKNSVDFLASYSKKSKYAGRLARGRWFFVVFPFA